MFNKDKYIAAFSLIEMAIVLVITGLLVAVVISGQALISSANIRSFISEIEEIKVAAIGFKDQYDKYPGDLDNATSFFSSTADGDGNGQIDSNAEYFDFWQHLSLAKLYSAKLSAIGDSGATNVATIGITVPKSSNFNVGFSIRWDASPWSYSNDLGRSFPANYNYIGANNSANYLSQGRLSVEDAHAVDKKLDDGTPDYGSVLAAGDSGDDDCVTGAAPNIIYDFSSNISECLLAITID